MARANVRTLLSLDRFAAVCGLNPIHFNGVFVPDIAPDSACSDPTLQYAWQGNDKVGREDIAQAIAQAEDAIHEWLGYLMRPDWVAQEPHGLARGNTWRWPRLKLDKGYVLTGGVENKTFIANEAVTYNDTDGDGYKETATVSIVTSVTADPQEIALYYPSESGDDAWEIRPIKVAYNAQSSTFTVTFRREQAVVATALESADQHTRSVDGTNDANFLPSVDVYRHWNDPSTQVQFAWSVEASQVPSGVLFSACSCGLPTCSSCMYAKQYGCLSIQDARLGVIVAQPGDWDGTTSTYVNNGYSMCTPPYRADVWYRSGRTQPRLARPLWDMDPMFERAIAYLALSYLDRPMCDCDAVESLVDYWSEDVTQSHSKGDESSSSRQSRAIMDIPLGTTRGAIQAWRMIQRERLGEAVGAV